MIEFFIFGFIGISICITLFLSRLRIAIGLPILLFLGYFAIQPIPSYLGYPIQERFVQGQEAIVLGGFNDVLMVIIKGQNTPRLVEVQDKEKAKQAMKRSKEKPTFVVFGSGSGIPKMKNDSKEQEGTPGENDREGSGGNGLSDDSGLRILKDGEQTMLEKTAEE